MDFFIRKTVAHLAPFGNDPLRTWFPHFLQLGNSEVIDPRVRRTDHNCQTVISDRDFNVLDVGFFTRLCFACLDRPRSIADIGFSTAKAFKSATGPGNADHDLNSSGSLLEFFRNSFGDREYCAGPVNPDQLTGCKTLKGREHQAQYAHE